MHLTKDFGLIPYTLMRDYGYRSWVITFNNCEYTALKDEVTGLEIVYLKKVPSNFFRLIRAKKYASEGSFVKFWLLDKIDVAYVALHALPLLLREGRKIDVLQVYHFRYESSVIGILYHLINPGGILYLKMDTEADHYKYYEEHPEKLKWKPHLSHLLFRLASFNLISVEGSKLLDFYRERHPLLRHYRDRLIHVPNGVNVRGIPDAAVDYDQKENLIIHPARIGTRQKASEILLNAFAAVSPEYPEWKLVLVGAIDAGFKEYFDQFLKEHGDIAGRIVHINFLADRDDLYRYFKKAKIVALPSRFETFSLAMLEACYYGDVLLGTDISTAVEMTQGGKYGYLCKVDDQECFTRTLRYMLGHEDELREKSTAISRHVRETYDWNVICGKLEQELVVKAKQS